MGLQLPDRRFKSVSRLSKNLENKFFRGFFYHKNLVYHLDKSDTKGFNMKKILVIEDDLALSTGLCFELNMSGYLTVAAYNCQNARQFLQNERFDLIILDVNLPDGNGFDYCREVKVSLPELLIIFLTARDMEQDELNGFELGAEDYIVKPFNMQILKHRVEAVLRRGNSSAKNSSDYYEDTRLQLNFAALTAVCNGKKLAITPNEYKLLRILITNTGNLVTRHTLLEKLWDCDGNYIDDHTLTVTMNRLRAKIETEGYSYIQTVRGMGYIWTGARKQ